MTEIIVSNGWKDRLESLAGRRRESWALLGLVTVVVVGGLALWSRGTSPQVAPPAIETEGKGFGPAPEPAAGPVSAATQAAPQGAAASAAGAGAPAEVIFVHIAGAVRRPGLYELPAGSRVADGIDAARGPRSEADLDALNLAAVLTDGTKLDVLRRGESGGALAPAATGASPSATTETTTTTGAPSATTPGAAPIPLNSADQAALETIPGVGPVTATAMLEYRSQIGAFQSIDQLLEVSGIGPATLESIRPYVTI